MSACPGYYSRFARSMRGVKEQAFAMSRKAFSMRQTGLAMAITSSRERGGW
jgi:hypothetical protein